MIPMEKYFCYLTHDNMHAEPYIVGLEAKILV